jgi:hypothetical protein
MPNFNGATFGLVWLAALWPGGAAAQTRHTVVVTELGYLYRVNGPHGEAGAPQAHYLNGEAGFLLRRGARTSVGVTVFAGALVDYAFTLRVGLKGRVRRWLGSNASLEAGAGPILGRVTSGRFENEVASTGIGLTAHVALNLDDRLSMLAALETLGNESEPRPSLWVGARLGSRPALWAGGIAALGLGLAALLVGS